MRSALPAPTAQRILFHYPAASRLFIESTPLSSVIASGAKQSRGCGLDSGLLRRSAPRNDAWRHAMMSPESNRLGKPRPAKNSFVSSRRDWRPSFALIPPSECGGRREGRASTEARGPRANKNARGRKPQVRPDDPAFPARWLTAYTRSPRCTGLFGHRVATMRLRALRWTPASGCQDHATSPSVPAALVSCSRHVHRIPPQRP